MKKVIKLIVLCGAMAFLSPVMAAAEKVDSVKQVVDTTKAVMDGNKAVAEVKQETPAVKEAVVEEETSFHQIIKEKISEGGIEFMSIVLICLILGLIVAVERVVTLGMSSSNIKKLLKELKGQLSNGTVDEAKEFCAAKTGPVAGIFAEGLLRAEDGKEAVQEAVDNYGSAEMTKLEKGLSWISLFIALAPMFGFMGTVIGMIEAFDSIQNAGEIQIAEVAGGIKTALLTTVAGLVVAVILQVFYNYIMAKIDDISSEMEDASNEFMKLLRATGSIK